MIILEKEIGETPLEALEKYRQSQILAGKNEFRDIAMTYAGRLDPMAEGKLLILVGEECKNKDRYLNCDKEYEIEIVFGIETDTYDALGLVTFVNGDIQSQNLFVENQYIGKAIQPYPPYSSKTFEGEHLHNLARKKSLPTDLPKKEVEIYSLQKLEERSITERELKDIIIERIHTVKGDFRQKEIMNRWSQILTNDDKQLFIIKLRVKCSSGTYMRSLAHRIGKDLGTGAFALSIKRTQIYIN